MPLLEAVYYDFGIGEVCSFQRSHLSKLNCTLLSDVRWCGHIRMSSDKSCNQGILRMIPYGMHWQICKIVDEH